MIRFRMSKQLNRIKEYTTKLSAFLSLQNKYTEDLKNGWNPLNQERVIAQRPTATLNLAEAIEKFVEYHNSKGNRLKTIQSYRSKLYLKDLMKFIPGQEFNKNL